MREGGGPLLEVRNLKKSFGGPEVLKGVDLQVNKGDVVAILGPSGSGKTTLLRCMNFLERADGGTMTFDGESHPFQQITGKDVVRLRKRTGFVFQNYNLFRNRTALQNVTEGLVIGQKDAEGPGGGDRRAGIGKGGDAGPPGRLPQPALRRPAAAGGHRPGHCRGTGDHLL